jgi:hypothetical protein
VELSQQQLEQPHNCCRLGTACVRMPRVAARLRIGLAGDAAFTSNGSTSFSPPPRQRSVTSVIEVRP